MKTKALHPSETSTASDQRNALLWTRYTSGSCIGFTCFVHMLTLSLSASRLLQYSATIRFSAYLATIVYLRSLFMHSERDTLHTHNAAHQPATDSQTHSLYCSPSISYYTSSLSLSLCLSVSLSLSLSRSLSVCNSTHIAMVTHDLQRSCY